MEEKAKTKVKDTLLIIMLKDKEGGVITGEAAESVLYGDNEHYIDGVYSVKNDDGGFTTFVKLTAGKNRVVEDWQFDAVYDYYDESVLEERIDTFAEVEESSDPAWEVSFTFTEEEFDFKLEKRLNGILQLHKEEIAAVFAEIEDKKNDYEEQEKQL